MKYKAMEGVKWLCQDSKQRSGIRTHDGTINVKWKGGCGPGFALSYQAKFSLNEK